ncbi:hypothetical protein G9A89_010449 [Geosiphon pyriformis]|nr:hypothetical protein G9A89_010449 [Geosiphon pyriformis]
MWNSRIFLREIAKFSDEELQDSKIAGFLLSGIAGFLLQRIEELRNLNYVYIAVGLKAEKTDLPKGTTTRLNPATTLRKKLEKLLKDISTIDTIESLSIIQRTPSKPSDTTLAEPHPQK